MDEKEIAAEVFGLLGTGRQVERISAREPGFDLAMAYRVVPRLRELREAAADRVAGRKIGFTNRTIWAEYEVYAPMWNYVWASTLFDLATLPQPFSLSHLSEPRLEPEIILGLARAPRPGMSVVELAGCLAWVAHGFEIVQSLFAGWRFAPADTVAGYGLHGALFVGPKHHVEGDPAQLADNLERFEIELSCNGESRDVGQAANVLGGPLHALKHLVDLLGEDRHNPQVAAGEVVTTGTVTRAMPIGPGETWSTAVRGIDLEGAMLRFA